MALTFRETANADAATVREASPTWTSARAPPRSGTKRRADASAASNDGGVRSERDALKCVLVTTASITARSRPRHRDVVATDDVALFDDASTAPVGALEDVRASLSRGGCSRACCFTKKRTRERPRWMPVRDEEREGVWSECKT